jgi:hypothetical protein
MCLSLDAKILVYNKCKRIQTTLTKYLTCVPLVNNSHFILILSEKIIGDIFRVQRLSVTLNILFRYNLPMKNWEYIVYETLKNSDVPAGSNYFFHISYKMYPRFLISKL